MGEEGVLAGVEIAQAGNALLRHLALTMEHRGNGSSAVLLLRRRGERHP